MLYMWGEGFSAGTRHVHTLGGVNWACQGLPIHTYSTVSNVKAACMSGLWTSSIVQLVPPHSPPRLVHMPDADKTKLISTWTTISIWSIDIINGLCTPKWRSGSCICSDQTIYSDKRIKRPSWQPIQLIIHARKEILTYSLRICMVVPLGWCFKTWEHMLSVLKFWFRYILKMFKKLDKKFDAYVSIFMCSESHCTNNWHFLWHV
jgi:hypothetical protein